MSDRTLNICFYISDYGYGHAARDIAVIRRLLTPENGQGIEPANAARDVKIFVKTDGPHSFIEQSLPAATAIRSRNDIGPVYNDGRILMNREATERSLERWLSSWDEYISRERAFCRDNDIGLILSDIVPQAFIVAEDLGIPGIGISNFTWHYIFFNIFGKTDATDVLEDAYARGDLALVLPFNETMSLFKRKEQIGLVSRKADVDRSVLRKRYGVQEDETLIYIGIGRSLDPSFLRSLEGVDRKGVRFLTSSNIYLPRKDAIRIPAGEMETQNYIAMCDLVVSKTGYSTVSEAIRACVPMLLFKREGFKEDCLIADEVKRLSIGEEISETSFLDGGWLDMLDRLDTYRSGFETLDDRFKRDGTSEATEVIFEDILEEAL